MPESFACALSLSGSTLAQDSVGLGTCQPNAQAHRCLVYVQASMQLKRLEASRVRPGPTRPAQQGLTSPRFLAQAVGVPASACSCLFSIVILQFVLVSKMCVNENRENLSPGSLQNILFCVCTDPALLPFLFGKRLYSSQVLGHPSCAMEARVTSSSTPFLTYHFSFTASQTSMPHTPIQIGPKIGGIYCKMRKVEDGFIGLWEGHLPLMRPTQV